MRTSPNIIITGTPGVGKTVHCEQLAQETGLRHLSINKVAKDRDCFESYDDELGSWVIDEDKVCLVDLFTPGDVGDWFCERIWLTCGNVICD